ncbi:MAG TPA: DUF2231 domain-containing protein [Phycisphaerae bacterium]|nr:DUF2231 domain-containing protein [Phycisphaerae bacterium]
MDQTTSTIVEGILVDAAWFASDPGSENDRLAKAAKRLAEGGLAAVLPKGGEKLQDLLYLLTSPAVLAPYAGATVKVEGRILDDFRSIRPSAMYVWDNGKWREIQLQVEHQKSAAAPHLQDAERREHEHATPHERENREEFAHTESASHRDDQAASGHNDRRGEHKHDHIIMLPPVHPLLVNFTAGLFPIAVLADWLGRLLHRQSLSAAGWWVLLFAAITTPFTALAGWRWLGEVGDMGHWQMAIHPWLGTCLAILIPGLAFWRAIIYRRGDRPEKLYLMCATALLLALIVQGHLGATMTFGHGHDKVETRDHHQ